MQNNTVQCSAQSLGAASSLVNLILQTLITTNCALTDPNRWPQDYGEIALKNGESTFE